MSERHYTDFSWRQFVSDAVRGYWSIGWDSRKPLPMWIGGAHVFYDWHWYGFRVWRVYVTIDPIRDRRSTQP